MNETNAEHERIERLLKQAHVPEPSDPLKNRVTTAAQQAWEQSATDVPWRIPVRRLALSAAAAVVIVSLANHFSNLGVPRAYPNRHPVMPADVPDLETLPEAPRGPLMNRLVQTGRRPTRINGSALRNYLENIQQLLRDVEDNGTEETPRSSGGGSGLLPNHSGFGTYS